MTQLIIHGHFYQPPRENPWTERVPEEPSAAPFHDWNLRVYEECYRPCAHARIVNSLNQVERISNIYSLISFNFGPTLLAWIDRHHPETVTRLIEADQQSMERFGGHGNAIGQAYNHSILPLCNERDRKTQVRWGLADFQHYFARRPESLWLPETAANESVLEDLIEEQLRYVILSPFQAGRVRPLAGGDWIDASGGQVDTSRPYRFLHRDGSGRSIDVFFYHGNAAQSVAFGGALHSSEDLVTRLNESVTGRLLNIATDGETYGHHTKFGERSLAYALEALAPPRGFTLTNYGAFLDDHPPGYEVELAKGEDGRGTAWSCAHGVGRWYRDCGCSTGGLPGWNQAWRTPLRAGLDRVRDTAATFFEHEGRRLFEDPWLARDEYIEVILDREHKLEPFLARHMKGSLDEPSRVRALSLLEMQRSTMLMYTSCGWFFNDISGIETVQILKYAARVVDLFEQLELPSPEHQLVEALGEAKSNIKKVGTGADLYRSEVRPYIVSPPRMAAHLALFDLAVDNHRPPEGDGGGFHYVAHHQKLRHGRVALSIGDILLRSSSTHRSDHVQFAAVHFGGADFYCAAGPFRGKEHHDRVKSEILERFKTASLPVLIRLLQEGFGPEDFGLEHVLPDLRHMLSETVFSNLVRRFEEEYAFLYQDNRRTLEMLQAAGFNLPDELRTAAQFTLGRRLEEEIAAQAYSEDPKAYRKALEIAEEAERQGLNVARPGSARIFTNLITEATRRSVREPTDENFETAIDLVDLNARLGLKAVLDRAQEAVYTHRSELRSSPKALELAEVLNLASDIFRDQ